MIELEEALRRARQWRDEGACGPAAVVAIALLNELERANINVAAYRSFTADMLVSRVEVRPEEGVVALHKTRAAPEVGHVYKFAKWPDYMGAEVDYGNMFRLLEMFGNNKGAGLFGNGRRICVELDDLLQVHLPPSALKHPETGDRFAGPAHKAAVAVSEQWYKPILGK